MAEQTVAEQARIEEALRGVLDPELGVNIIDLGLVYGAARLPNGEIYVQMTMTTPVCPLSRYLLAEVGRALQQAFPGAELKVELVWDPPWDPSRMSAEARRQLGWDG